MATNGTAKKANGSKPPKRAKALSYQRRPVPKPTAAQLRAMREFVRQSGHTFTKDEIDETRAQWRG